MKITWTFRMPYDDGFSARDIPKIAELIWASATTCGLPPDEIIIENIGRGNYLYDLLKENYKINVKLDNRLDTSA